MHLQGMFTASGILPNFSSSWGSRISKHCIPEGSLRMLLKKSTSILGLKVMLPSSNLSTNWMLNREALTLNHAKENKWSGIKQNLLKNWSIQLISMACRSANSLKAYQICLYNIIKQFKSCITINLMDLGYFPKSKPKSSHFCFDTRGETI